jgi:hypothetical protein
MAETRTRLRRVTAAQTSYIAYWDDRGTPTQVTLTEAEYTALGAKGAGVPPRAPHRNATFLYAQAQTRWDTPDGLRHPGDITDAFPGVIEVLTEQGKRQAFPVAECEGTLANLSTFRATTTRNGTTIEAGDVKETR